MASVTITLAEIGTFPISFPRWSEIPRLTNVFMHFLSRAVNDEFLMTLIAVINLLTAH